MGSRIAAVARIREKELVRLIGAGAADMLGPAMVVLLAGGVSVIMTNTQTLELTSRASAARSRSLPGS